MYILQTLLLTLEIGKVLLQTESVSPLTIDLGYLSEQYHKEPAHRQEQYDRERLIPKYGDAQHRGDNWYDDYTDSSRNDKSSSSSTSSLVSSSSASNEEESIEASSFETRERLLQSRVYRTCTPCPHEMLKSYKNIGIKWICAGYQRARRSFKSDCMMRYRNCQDGTLFIKLYNQKCKNDSYHGRHFFYHYRT